jgi:predicted PurR-regulated permease PerM
MQNNRWFQTLIVLLVIIATGFIVSQVWDFIKQFSSVILLFFMSWLLAFILRPLAKWLMSRGVGKTLSVAIVYLGLLLVLTIAGFLLVPVISAQVEQLIAQVPAYATDLENMIVSGQELLKRWDVQAADLERISSELLTQAQNFLLAALQNTFNILQSVATLALQTIFVILISFYIMKDGDRLASGLLRMLPPRWEDEIRLAGLSIEKSFGGFLRGQLLFALVYGVFTAVIMMVPPFQLDYVVIASIVAGLAMIIPLVGNFIAYFPPLLVCIVTKPELWLPLAIVLFVAQSFILNVVSPRIMSGAIGMHPIYVVGAMLVGGQLAGFWGALFGIPVAGALNLIGRPLLRRMRHQMAIYQEEPSRSLPTSAFVTGPLAVQMAQAHQTTALSPDTPLEEVAVVEEGPVRPVRPQNTLADMEEDADLMVQNSPTLTARAWRLVIVGGSRAANWAWDRARRRPARPGDAPPRTSTGGDTTP